MSVSSNSTARSATAPSRNDRRKVLFECPRKNRRCKEVGKMGRGANWTSEDDVLLCLAYLDTSQDPLTGADQTKSHFWEKIMAFIKNANADKAKASGKPSQAPERSIRSSQSRFAAINTSVTKFAAAHAKAQRYAASGTNDEDIERAACQLYRADQPGGKGFEFRECWYVMKAVPRWSSDPPTPTTQPDMEPAPQSPSEVPGTPPFSAATQNVRGRPIGVKKTRQELSEGRDVTKQIHTLQACNVLANKRARILQQQVALGYFKLDLESVPIEMREMFLITRNQLMKELQENVILAVPPEAAIPTPLAGDGLQANSPASEATGDDYNATSEGGQGYRPDQSDQMYGGYQGEQEIEREVLPGEGSSTQIHTMFDMQDSDLRIWI